MNNQHVDVDITTQAAFAYVRRSLRSGLDLGRLVNSSVSEDTGLIQALVGQGANAAQLGAFESGGVLSQPKTRSRGMTATPSANVSMACRAKAFLDCDQAVIVVEDIEGYLQTPAADSLSCQTRLLGAESYAFLFGSQNDVSQIARVLQVAYSLPTFNTVWAVLPPGAHPGSDATQLRLIADHVRCVAVGAYDAESYLIWTPHR